ncbi:putative membrane protein At3g27390 [Curcuma longa]|uniref:putative membrane protein At3g27390 n=1 Tax=Curcuma longa TaxID=136217 RepID=UPI003D9EE69B
MDAPLGFASRLGHLLAFIPFFLLLLLLAIVKAAIIAPIVFVTVFVGITALIVGLYPCHAFWTCYCVARTKKFGSLLKVLLLMLMPVLLLLWPFAATIGAILAGLGFGIALPLMATFEAIREGVQNKFTSCFKAGTWSSIKRGFTIVRDFKDICFHTYFSIMDGLLEARGETIMDMRISQVPGCLLAGLLGVFIDVPMISFIVLYKAPVMLLKGWGQLIQDLLGRSGPFLESVCVPFAGLLILLWPLAVCLASAAGISSSLFLGCYASVVVYQENSTKSGILYVIAVISMFDEFTNDFLYMREGSCFPRPKYRQKPSVSRSLSLPLKRAPTSAEPVPLKRPLIKTPSMKMQELKSVVIWENFFKSCESVGTELIQAGAIHMPDLEEWQNSKNKIVNIGLPSCVILQCCVRSIKFSSVGFIMRDNLELTYVNRPEGMIFDWLFEPMLVLKEQISAAKLKPEEEEYLQKLALYCGDTRRVSAWQNGGVAPSDEVKRAQLEGLIRRLQGFSLTISRMPTFRRRFEEVVDKLMREASQGSHGNGNSIEGKANGFHYSTSV